MIKLIKYFRFPTFSAANWSTQNPTLDPGELGLIKETTNSNVIGAKIGNGTSNFSTLPYFGATQISPTITLNVSGNTTTSIGAGIQVEEGGIVKGKVTVNSTRTGFDLLAPTTYTANLLLSSLTANRQYTFPNQSGTIALLENSLSNVLNNGQIWIGDGTNVAVGRTMSGDATISNTGVLTLAQVSLTTKVTGILPIANGGTGTSTAFTSGRVIFAGASGVYSQDDGFNWDSTNNALSIGVNNPIRIHNAGDAAAGNTFIGQNAGNYSVTGLRNISIGESSGALLTSGYSNILMGAYTGEKITTGGANILIGNSTGSNIINSSFNICIGDNTFLSSSNGDYNIILGKSAGNSTVASTAVTTLSNSILIGYNTKPLANADTNEIVIGFDASGYGSNTAVLGNSSITNTYLRGTLNLTTIPTSAPAETKLLVVDSSGVVKYRDSSTIVAVGSGHVIYNGASALTQRANLTFKNGLTAADNTTETLAKLGGALTENTNITGSSYYLNLAPDNVALFGSSPTFGGGTGVMYMRVATTPPSTPPSSGVFMWVEAVNGNYELRVMDSVGNIKGLS